MKSHVMCVVHLLSQDEDLDYSSPHLELGHNQRDNHSTFTLISELQNPCKLKLSSSHIYVPCPLFLVTVYQSVTNNNPDGNLNLDSLLIQLRVEVTPKWREFGVAVGVPQHLLDQYSNYPVGEQLIQVVNYWLKNHHHPTWGDMAELLHDIELHELADSINVLSSVYTVHQLSLIQDICQLKLILMWQQYY